MTTPTTTPRISRITIARLFNIGRYEHIRYEIAVEVPEGANPATVFTEISGVIEDLNPKAPHDEYQIKVARQQLERPAGTLEKWDLDQLPSYQQKIKEQDAHLAKLEAARQALGNFGGTSKYTDAKDNWDQNPL